MCAGNLFGSVVAGIQTLVLKIAHKVFLTTDPEHRLETVHTIHMHVCVHIMKLKRGLMRGEEAISREVGNGLSVIRKKLEFTCGGKKRNLEQKNGAWEGMGAYE